MNEVSQPRQQCLTHDWQSCRMQRQGTALYCWVWCICCQCHPWLRPLALTEMDSTRDTQVSFHLPKQLKHSVYKRAMKHQLRQPTSKLYLNLNMCSLSCPTPRERRQHALMAVVFLSSNWP